MTLGSKEIVVTRASNAKEVKEWLKKSSVAEKMNKFGSKLVLGLSSYWRQKERKPHTLCLCLGKRVLVVDVDKLGKIPPKLTNVLKSSTVWCHGVEKQAPKLAEVDGFEVGGFVDLKTKNHELKSGYACDLDRNVPKEKIAEDPPTKNACYHGAMEAFACYKVGISGVKMG